EHGEQGGPGAGPVAGRRRGVQRGGRGGPGSEGVPGLDGPERRDRFGPAQGPGGGPRPPPGAAGAGSLILEWAPGKSGWVFRIFNAWSLRGIGLYGRFARPDEASGDAGPGPPDARAPGAAGSSIPPSGQGRGPP